MAEYDLQQPPADYSPVIEGPLSPYGGPEPTGLPADDGWLGSAGEWAKYYQIAKGIIEGDKVGLTKAGVYFVNPYIGLAADIVDFAGLNQSGQAMESIRAQQIENMHTRAMSHAVMDVYTEWLDREGVENISAQDKAIMKRYMEAAAQDPAYRDLSPDDLSKSFRDYLENFDGMTLADGTVIPKPEAGIPPPDPNTPDLYETIKAGDLGGVDESGEGRIGTVTTVNDPLNTSGDQLNRQAGIDPYSLDGMEPLQLPDVSGGVTEGWKTGSGGFSGMDASTGSIAGAPSGAPTTEGVAGGGGGIDPVTGAVIGGAVGGAVSGTGNKDWPGQTPPGDYEPPVVTGGAGSTGTASTGGTGTGTGEDVAESDSTFGVPNWLWGVGLEAGTGLWNARTADKAADKIASANLEAARMSDITARDLTQTSISLGKEARDIGLGLADPYLTANVSGLAAAADMLGIPRDLVPSIQEAKGTGPAAEFTPDNTIGGDKQFGWKNGEYGFIGQGGEFQTSNFQKPPPEGGAASGATTESGTYAGSSMYEPEYEYPLERIDEIGSTYQNAPEYKFEQSPGFQFAVDQGIDKINSRFSATSSARSGGADKEVVNYVTGAAWQDFDNQYNRVMRFAGLGGSQGGVGTQNTGAGAVQNIGGQNMQNQYSATTSTGMAKADAALQKGAAWSNTINDFAYGLGRGG